VCQVKIIVEENAAPDNYINPKKISRIEQTMLKEIFKRIEKFPGKLSFDFSGMTYSHVPYGFRFQPLLASGC
jgi:CBS domain-containing protein